MLTFNNPGIHLEYSTNLNLIRFIERNVKLYQYVCISSPNSLLTLLSHISSFCSFLLHSWASRYSMNTFLLISRTTCAPCYKYILSCSVLESTHSPYPDVNNHSICTCGAASLVVTRVCCGIPCSCTCSKVFRAPDLFPETAQFRIHCNSGCY